VAEQNRVILVFLTEWGTDLCIFMIPINDYSVLWLPRVSTDCCIEYLSCIVAKFVEAGRFVTCNYDKNIVCRKLSVTAPAKHPVALARIARASFKQNIFVGVSIIKFLALQ
jgi:hypothetical protein